MAAVVIRQSLRSSDREEFFGGKRVTDRAQYPCKGASEGTCVKGTDRGKRASCRNGTFHGDVDSFGACIGIYRIAKTLNRKANIVLNEVQSFCEPFMDRFYAEIMKRI